ncbi:MAG: hypothetical protein P4L36_15580 [Holophaga sp.]|nr:hypothetical protein [Holophaga sp.]
MRMLIWVCVVLAVVFLSLATTAVAGQLEDGIAEMQVLHQKRAIALLKPLAEQGTYPQA